MSMYTWAPLCGEMCFVHVFWGDGCQEVIILGVPGWTRASGFDAMLLRIIRQHLAASGLSNIDIHARSVFEAFFSCPAPPVLLRMPALPLKLLLPWLFSPQKRL